MFLQASLLICLGRCGSSPVTVAATLAADSLPAYWEAATPPPCKFCSLSPVASTDGITIPVPSLKVVPSFFLYFSWLDSALQC